MAQDLDDLDFSSPKEQKAIYDSSGTQAFFGAAGKTETHMQGAKLFSAGEHGDKMYLLIAGDVALSVGGKAIDTIRKGEIFGEMSAISGQPRTADASAKTPCQVMSLDRKQFLAALRSQPEFSLNLMHMMISRLRLTLATLKMRGALKGQDAGHEGRVMDFAALNVMMRALGEKARMHYPLNRTIITEGTAGIFMYVVIEGNVVISIQQKVVERVGPGGVFGELALIDQGTRAASAVAASDCTLLAVDRNSFLDLVRKRPEIGVELLKNLSERLRYLTALRK